VKILIVSDTWRPQINGVVRTLEMTERELGRLGHETRIVGPEADRWATLAVPFYPEIKLELFSRRRLARVFDDFAPEHVHIATEGPLGMAGRRICLKRGIPFNTAYHTRFPEYLAARVPKPLAVAMSAVTYAVLRWFHRPATEVLVATASMQRELAAHGFERLACWSRGVDLEQFQLYGKDLPAFAGLPRPILIYVGRLAIEKNLRGFLSLRTLGSKVVVGDGPDAQLLKHEFSGAHFLGAMSGEPLARAYAAADLFVFPSLSDTFGLVLLEACAAGLRVAATPAPGPLDIFGSDSGVAVLDADLGHAVAGALKLPDDPQIPRAFAQRFTWAACTEQFCDSLRRTRG